MAGGLNVCDDLLTLNTHEVESENIDCAIDQLSGDDETSLY